MASKPISYANWLSEFTEEGFRRPLTDDEQTALKRAYEQHAGAALRKVRKITHFDDAEAWDVVHGGLTRMIRHVTEDRKPLPTEARKLRRRFLNYVKWVALQVAASSEFVRPIGKFWGEKLEPTPGRKVPERPLRRDMDSARDSSMLPEGSGGYRQPLVQQADLDEPGLDMGHGRPYESKLTTLEQADELWELDWIMECACEQLPPAQKAIIEHLLDGRTRREICELQQIQPPTYDTHYARAKENMRFTLLACRPWLVLNPPWWPEGCHFSEWSAEFTRLEERRLARLHAPPDRSAA